MKALIVGGGQLGQSLARSFVGDCEIVSGVPWADAVAARHRITAAATEFVAASRGVPWIVCWCAGTGVVGTPESVLADERRALGALLTALEAAPGFDPSSGAFFLASSAGGIYASGSGEISTEATAVKPLSDYGRSKLTQDEMVSTWATRVGLRTMIGRISNLYGPRQDVRKPQGFISHLCRAMALRTLFTLTVPISTIRDFIFADDVAARVFTWANEPPTRAPAEIKILAAGRSVTLGHVISMTTAISHSRARVLLAAPGRDQVNHQPAALRFQSRTLVHLDTTHPARPLEEGIRATWQDALAGLQSSPIAR